MEYQGLNPVAQRVKNPPTMQETWVWSLYQEDPLEERMVTRFSILAWRIPWTGEPCELQSMESQRIRHSWGTKYKEPQGFPGALVVKNLSANAGDVKDAGSIPGPGRSPGERNGNPLLYSSLENPKNRGAWQATVHGVSKSQTQLGDLAHTHSSPWEGGSCWVLARLSLQKTHVLVLTLTFLSIIQPYLSHFYIGGLMLYHLEGFRVYTDILNSILIYSIILIPTYLIHLSFACWTNPFWIISLLPLCFLKFISLYMWMLLTYMESHVAFWKPGTFKAGKLKNLTQPLPSWSWGRWESLALVSEPDKWD